MYIITNKEDNRILNFAKELDYLENGYPKIIEQNLAYPDILVNVYEIETVPKNIEKEKYCYTEEQGFYPNENYVEPIPEISNAELQQQITDLQLALTEIYESGV